MLEYSFESWIHISHFFCLLNDMNKNSFGGSKTWAIVALSVSTCTVSYFCRQTPAASFHFAAMINLGFT